MSERDADADEKEHAAIDRLESSVSATEERVMGSDMRDGMVDRLGVDSWDAWWSSLDAEGKMGCIRVRQELLEGALSQAWEREVARLGLEREWEQTERDVDAWIRGYQ